MPRRSEGSNLPALPSDIREDLLRAQAETISSPGSLPQVKVLPGGVGQFEFVDTEETTREFSGVILNAHGRNALYDRLFGSDADEDEQGPACIARDGHIGTPRRGFVHAALGRAAEGNERIECATCPYNQWGSKRLMPLRPGDERSKGKAVSNYVRLYIMVHDRAVPIMLQVPPTSIPAYDEYMRSLTGRGIPVQAVVTKFAQERKEKNNNRWSVVTFSEAAMCEQEQFDAALQMRQQFRSQITPEAFDAYQGDAPSGRDVTPAGAGEDDGDIPF